MGLAGLVLGIVATPAGAAGAVYGAWTLSGANPSWSGTLQLPATGFPAATYTSNSNTPEIPSGQNVYLGPGTPFGAVFGSSQGQPYLNQRSAAGGLPSTMTVTFASPTPAGGGWGFALGDVDADRVAIRATGPDGPLTPDALGFQSAFNYCAASPTPPGCTSPPFTDQPTWDPTTGTLVGTGADTHGGAGWFRPTARLTSLTFTFTVLTGIPAYQLWFAALTSDISGMVTHQADAGPVPPPPGTTLQLRGETGEPVLDAAGSPLTATPAADGSYVFAGVAAGVYHVAVVPPEGYEVVGEPTRPADARSGDVTGVDFVLRAPPPPTTTTPTTSTPRAPALPPPTIPATGQSTGTLGVAGLAVAALGACCLLLSRRLT